MPAAARALAMLLAAAAASTVSAWGSTGHETTVAIGVALMEEEALAEAARILPPGQTLVNASVWADQVKYNPGWGWSKPLHFVNTPDWACGYAPSDCPDQVCVVGAIQNYTARLTSQTGEQQLEALKFLIHFLGDVHQPLHIGFGSDYGGNKYYGSFFGEDVNLHHIWDDSIIYKRMDTVFNSDQQAYEQYLIKQVQNGNYTSLAPAWKQCSASSPTWLCPDEWAGVSAKLACTNAYTDTTGAHITGGFKLGQPYFVENWPVVDEQLAKGGVRVALVLNKVLGALARQRRAAEEAADMFATA